MNAFIITMLRLALAAGFLVGLFGQALVVPNSLAHEIRTNYDPDLVAVSVVATVFGIALIQLVLVAGWFLIGMVERDAIFSERAFLWIDAIIGATVAATILAGGLGGVYLVFGDEIEEMLMLGAMGSFTACVGFGACFAMVMLIMRGLLRKATELKTEMAEVI